MLPDYLKEGLRFVLCGTAAGNRSCAIRHYYAGRGNRAWTILAETRLTSRELRPENDRSILEFGIGLTDLTKHGHGRDRDQKQSSFDVPDFTRKILKYRPRWVVFNGKKAGQVYFGSKNIKYGRQEQTIGQSIVFVLPSTSGAAARYWDPDEWRRFAKFLRH